MIVPSSYSSSGDSCSRLPGLVTRSLAAIQSLDDVASGLCADIDRLNAAEASQPSNASAVQPKSANSNKRGRDSDARGAAPESQHRRSEPRRRLAEALIDRKSRVAVGAYDLIDRCIRLVDDELNAIDEALVTTARLAGDAASAAWEGTAADLPSHGDSSAKRVSNEPVYCFCRRVAFGEMIACDNEDCLIEWFHFPCVGLSKHPKKQWYCRDCSKKMKAAATSSQ